MNMDKQDRNDIVAEIERLEELLDEYSDEREVQSWGDRVFQERIKPVLCGDNFFGNLFYPAWRGMDCPCCAFFRGVVTGMLIMAVIETLFDLIV